jgi:hypothetical protein
MKVGDLVRVKPDHNDVVYETINTGEVGLITDVLEGVDGFSHFEVVFPHDRGWYSDLELDVV